EVHSLLAHDGDRLVHFGFTHFERRTGDDCFRNVSYCDLGVDLQDSTVLAFGRILRQRARLEAGVTGNAQILFAHSVTKAPLHRVTQHLLADLFAIVLRYHFQGDFARAESLHFHRTRQSLQPGIDFVRDIGRGQPDAESPLEIAQSFQVCLHLTQTTE